MMLGARTAAWAKYGGGAPTARDYKLGGKAWIWDAIENQGYGLHETNPTVWTDVVNGLNLILYPAQSSSLEKTCFLDNRRYNSSWLNSSYYDGFPDDFLSLMTTDADKTFEFVFSFLNDFETVYANPSFQNGNVISFVGYVGNRPLFYVGESAQYGRAVTDYGNLMSYVLTREGNTAKLYENGVLAYTWTCASKTNSSLVIHEGQNIQLYDGTVNLELSHRCAIHSRALTADEIAANYAIDKARFSLP